MNRTKYDESYDLKAFEILDKSAGIPKKQFYLQVPSQRYKGILNSSQQCYIIAILQAFYTTQQLEYFLDKCRRVNQSPFLQSIKSLFNRLKPDNTQNIPIKVDDVKTLGPQIFQNINSQQDAHQYLLSLIDKIAVELQIYGNTQLRKEFQGSLQNKSIRTVKCLNCNRTQQIFQQMTVWTIPHESSLSQFTEQYLSDYQCSTCSSSSITTSIQFIPTSQLIFVHLNRFSFSNNTCHKQLTRSKIQRYFLNYQLKGIVFHIGQTISSGHYLYYYKINKKNWVELNDSQAEEIILNYDDQQFQHKLSFDYSPYILIYKQNTQSI